MVKICKKCLETKEANQFHKRDSGKSTLSYVCKTCSALKLKEWRVNNPDKAKAQDKRSNVKRYKNNPEKIIITTTIWAKNNPEKIKQIKKKWQSANPEARAATQNKRRANKLNATPQWADLGAIKQIYLNCPTGFHVDHIVPLQGKNVCGLHVHWNLQYLTPKENIKKSNKFIGIGA